MAQQTYTVDASESTVRWTGKKIFGQHYGKVPIKEGSFSLEDGRLKSGSFTLNVRDLTNEDLEGSRKQDLLEWLKSKEMFYTGKYPEAFFEIVSATAEANGQTYQVEGKLTIKGTTHSISFPVQISGSKEEVRVQAKLSFDRTRWDLKYGEGGIIGDMGNTAIKNEVEVEVDLVAESADL
ncbi:MAG: YceI family protein [Cyclobacteriaceae bacterium]